MPLMRSRSLVFTPDISVVDNVTARGVTGIGIYAKGTLEGCLY